MIDPKNRSRRLLSGATLVVLSLSSGCGFQSPEEADGPPPAPATVTIRPQVLLDLPSPSLALGVAEPAAPAASVPAAVPSGVKLQGRVIFEGSPPPRRVIKMSKDADCVKLHGDKPTLDESAIVAQDGGIQNAFVYIRRGAPKLAYPVPKEVIQLDQQGCMYRPRVQGMLVGQTLRVLNNDPVTHNVRSIPVRNRAFNFGQPAASVARDRVFDAPEREIEIQCDIHPWMHAYLFVMDHPYFAVSAADGGFEIANLPPGEYSLAVWHEVFGKQDRPLKVAAQDLSGVVFTFKP